MIVFTEIKKIPFIVWSFDYE